MPTNISLMKWLEKRYWSKSKAKQIYYSMENDWHKATSKSAIAKSKKDHPSRYKKPKAVVKKKVVKTVKKVIKKSKK